MGTYKHGQSILSTVISVLVILLSVAMLAFVWIVQDDVSSSVVVIFVEVDHIAQIMRNGIARVEPELLTLRDFIGKIETASEEIAQNINEEGIILRLLPQTVVDGLTTSSQSLRDNFIAVYDLLGATSEVLLALDNIPFIDIPEKSLSTIETLQDSMEDISEQVESLKSELGDLRLEASAKVSNTTNAAILLGDEADQFHSDLVQIDTDLDTIQENVRKYQRLTPQLIITTAIICSLFSGWVVYSQVVMISRSANSDREKIDGAAETPSPSKDEGNHT